MKQLADELAGLVADVRAVLEDLGLRGVHGEPLDAPQPDAVPVARAAPDEASAERDAGPVEPPGPESAADEGVARPPDRARPGARNVWSALASSARAAADVEMAHGAPGLERIRADLGECRRCTLCSDRRSIVFGHGDPQADLVIVGEAPGFQEDQEGVPFVGPAGEMLDKMLVNVLGLERREVYVVTVVKCRPPRGRAPEPHEVAACRPYLDRQLDAIQPKVLFVLGSVAYQALLGPNGGAGARGAWASYRGIPALPSFAPAYLQENPASKRDAFADLKALRRRYDELGGKRAPGS